MPRKLLSLSTGLIALFLMSIAGTASAEYYVVTQEYPCEECMVRAPTPHVYHSGHCYHTPRHHHYAHHHRSSVNMQVYYYYNVFPAPSACRSNCNTCVPTTRCGSCQPCNSCRNGQVVNGCHASRPRGHFVDTESHDFNYDMRTLDDDREY